MSNRTDAQRAAHAAYEKNRLRQIKAGTWNPRKSLEPTRKPTKIDLAWAAGFLEGEGAFGTQTDLTLRVRADQIIREPLARLLEIFGGGLSERGTKTVAGNTVYRWYAAGKRARGIMLALYPMMSAHKQSQIDGAITRHDTKQGL